MEQEKNLKAKLSLTGSLLLQCPICRAIYQNSTSFCTTDGTKLEETESGSASASVFADKYEILDEIGSGGMGTVYRVRQILSDKICALKVIPAESVNDTLIIRFQREAKLMAALDHANLGRIFDFGTFNNQPFIVMEYIDGIPLSKMISASPLSVEQTAEIFGQVLDGLAHAHKKGFLHRDIKPSNIIIINQTPALSTTAAGLTRAILLDFGIAKRLATIDDTDLSTSKAQALTRTGEMIGSPLYMSPEQVRGEKLTERSDLYSLGCAMFECLTGTPPFAGRSTVDTLIQHLEKPAPNLKEASLGRTYPAGLERAVRKLLAKDPDQRYQSAEETKHAIMRALTLDEEPLENTADKPDKTVNLVLLILLSSATVVTLSAVAYLTTQGERTARSTKPIIKDDKFAIDKAVFAVADVSLLDGKEQNTDSEYEAEEEQIDFRAPRPKKKNEYISLNGSEGSLALHGQTLEANRVEQIEKNKRLWGLGLADARFPHKMLGKLAGSLRILRLSGARMSDDDMKYVAQNKNLRMLFLGNNTITAKGIRHLASLRFLETLDLTNTKCDASAIYELRNLPGLKTLCININRQIDDKAAEAASSLVGLTELNIDDTKITGKGIAYLRHIPMLSNLSAKRLNLGDKGISTIQNIANLTVLRLSTNNITAAGIKSLLPLKHITSLEVGFNPIDEKAVPFLLKMPTIKRLNISATDLAPADILKLSALPVLRKIVARKISHLNEAHVHEFMSKCRTCSAFAFLPEAHPAYDRSEWRADEKIMAAEKKRQPHRDK